MSSTQAAVVTAQIPLTSKRTTNRHIQEMLQSLRTGEQTEVHIDLSEFALQTEGKVCPNPDSCQIEIIKVIHHGSTCAQSTKWENAANAYLQLLAHIESCPQHSRQEKDYHKSRAHLIVTFGLTLRASNRLNSMNGGE